jgi:hypothetical protein
LWVPPSTSSSHPIDECLRHPPRNFENRCEKSGPSSRVEPGSRSEKSQIVVGILVVHLLSMIVVFVSTYRTRVSEGLQRGPKYLSRRWLDVGPGKGLCSVSTQNTGRWSWAKTVTVSVCVFCKVPCSSNRGFGICFKPSNQSFSYHICITGCWLVTRATRRVHRSLRSMG